MVGCPINRAIVLKIFFVILMDYLIIAVSAKWIGLVLVGGLIGIHLGSRTDTPIRRLILNDIGPSLTINTVQRFQDKFSNPPAFNKLAEIEEYVRASYAEIGLLEDVQWSDYVIHSINREPGPSYTLNYDPEVLGAFKPENLWDKYDRIECPVLVIQERNRLFLIMKRRNV